MYASVCGSKQSLQTNSVLKGCGFSIPCLDPVLFLSIIHNIYMHIHQSKTTTSEYKGGKIGSFRGTGNNQMASERNKTLF